MVGYELKWVVVRPDDKQAVRSALEFGRHARTRREFLGLSQQGVARLVNDDFGIPWHQTVVAKIEAGQRQVKLNEALALSLVYGTSLDNLVAGKALETTGTLVTRDLSKNDALVAEVQAAQERRRGNGIHPEEA